MKSAYELAMERLQKEKPSSNKKLSVQQKKRLADIDSLYKSKIAEKEILLKPKIAEARRMGDDTSAVELERQLVADLQKLREECEGEKEKIRSPK